MNNGNHEWQLAQEANRDVTARRSVQRGKIGKANIAEENHVPRPKA